MHSQPARPILKLDRDYAHPVAPIVIAAMKKSKHFYIRQRRGVRPAVWRLIPDDGTFIPMTRDRLAFWILREFECRPLHGATGERALAEALARWVLMLLRERDRDALPDLSDAALEVV
jgi:hypothetical protein